jgi:hypothetical protein
MSEIDIFSSPVELNTEPSEAPVVETEAKEETLPKVEQDTLETLESDVQQVEDRVPLKKYMSEKNARKEAETRATTLEQELQKLRDNPSKTVETVNVDVKNLSEKHGIDEEVLRDILSASYTLTEQKVREKIEQEFNPKLKEFEDIKRDQIKKEFENKFENILQTTLRDMPEYADIIDKDDIKDWIRSGKYSKLTMPQLIENKYSKFVPGKKTLESGHSSKEVSVPDTNNMTNDDYAKLDTDPELRKKWASGLEDRLRNVM